MGVILISVGGIAIIAGGVWLMLRADRSDQRKIERIREEFEASGSEKPWLWGVGWGAESVDSRPFVRLRGVFIRRH
jgi:hypothetical protein